MYIGVDIGGTKCAVVAGDENLCIINKVQFPSTDLESTLSRIVTEIEKMPPSDAIGISCGGPLDEEKGIIMSPPNLPGWDNVHITEMLSERFGVPVYLRNDANACALAEWRHGAGIGTRNMIFLTFGTGLGAGLILNGRLYSGTNGNAGEVGHIRLADDGPEGYGKAGSFEGFCSGGGIAELGKRLAIEKLRSGQSPAFAADEKSVDLITTKLLAEFAKGGDKDAIAVFDHSARMLGLGLSILIDILNPELIVIGSVFARSEDLFIKNMNDAIMNEALDAGRSVCKILPSSLGESIGDVAALTVAMEGKI